MNVRSNLSKQIKKVFTKSIFKKFSVLAVMLVFSACSFEGDDNSEKKELTLEEICRIERYANLTKTLSFSTSFDVAFIGDSLTANGDFENVFAEKNCINLGIPGDKISDLRRRVLMVKETNPKKLFIMIGVNSLNTNEDSFYNLVLAYEFLIAEIRTLVPDTQIYIESVLPVVNSVFVVLPNDVIRAFNVQVNRIAQKYGATYIDLYSLYEVDGCLNESLTYDGLHLKDFAYQAWYDEVAKYMD